MSFKRTLALILALSMCFALALPGVASADDNIADPNAVENVPEGNQQGAEEQGATYYTVKFDANGGDEKYEPQSVKAGENVVKPADPTQKGYVFDGWYEKYVDGGTGEDRFAVYDFDQPVTGDLELVALWNPTETKEEIDSKVEQQDRGLKGIWSEESGASAVAQIGDIKYTTLGAAINAAESGATILVLEGTWGADAIGSDEANWAQSRYKSLTIQPAEGASVTFTANVSLGYDDSSTANATVTVKNINFSGATLGLSNYVQATVEGCSFTGNGAKAGALVIQDSCTKNHKTADDYPASLVTVKNCSFNGTSAEAPAIRLRNAGNVSLTGNTVSNANHNGILIESNSSIDATPVKAVSITGNRITEWNAGNASGGGRAIRLDLGNLASGSTVNIKDNYFTKATVELDKPDFVKITGAGSASVDLSHNSWNYQPLSTVKNNIAYYTSDAAATISSVICYVAQIGDVKYETLAAAITDVPTNGTATTITMIADETIVGNAGVTIATNQNVVLDLNGFTVKNAVNENKASQVITNNGTLTIQDGSANGTGLLTNAIQEGTQPGEWWSTPQYNYATNVIKNSGTLNVESGTIRQTAAGSICYAIDNNSTSYDSVVNITGGTVTDDYGTVIRMFCNSTTKENEINISGGIVTTTGKAAIWTQLPGSDASSMKKATLNISGGTISGGTYAWYDYTFGDGWDNVNYSFIGGAFKGIVESEGKTGFISGGIYSVEPDAAYIAEGYIAVDNTDPETKEVYHYMIGKAPVAKIGETTYTTLADAIAAVPADGTATKITMIADETVNVATGALTIAAGKNVVLELNGKTVTGYCESGTASALFTNYGTLTIQDATDTNKDGTGSGKIFAGANPAWIYDGGDDYSGSYASNMIANRGVLVIESGYLESTTSGSAAYIIDNYTNGNVTINGGHLYNYHTNAIRLFCNSTTDGNSVTVKGGIIEGYCPIWVQGASQSTEKGSLVISGGTFKTTEKAVVNGEKTIAEGSSYLYMWPSNSNMSIEISGGVFDTNVCTWGNGKFTISGGRFGGRVYSATQTGFISGGIYAVEPTAKYIAEGLSAVANTDLATKDDYPYTIGHVHVYDYSKPNWKWTVINGNWSASVSYPCVKGDAYEVVEAVVTAGEVDPETSEVTYTATDPVEAHQIEGKANTDTKTVVETYTVTYNGEQKTFKYGTAFKAGEESGSTLYDWYVKVGEETPVLRAKGTSIFYLPVVENVTVTRQESSSQTTTQEPVANPSTSVTLVPKPGTDPVEYTGTVVYHVTWSLPQGAQITSEKIYRATSSISNTSVTKELVIEKGTPYNVDLNVRNGDYTYTVSNVAVDRKLHLVLEIKYTLPDVSGIQTLTDYTVVPVTVD